MVIPVDCLLIGLAIDVPLLSLSVAVADPPAYSSVLSCYSWLRSAPCLSLGLRWLMLAFAVVCAPLSLSFALCCSASHGSVSPPEPWQLRALSGTAFCHQRISPVPPDPPDCSSALPSYLLFSSAPGLPVYLSWLVLAFAVAGAPLVSSYVPRYFASPGSVGIPAPWQPRALSGAVFVLSLVFHLLWLCPSLLVSSVSSVLSSLVQGSSPSTQLRTAFM